MKKSLEIFGVRVYANGDVLLPKNSFYFVVKLNRFSYR